MTTENQNSAGTTSALAQKTGIKPLAKIIAGVCVAIVALVAFCSVFIRRNRYFRRGCGAFL